jgi:hypothetical protein
VQVVAELVFQLKVQTEALAAAPILEQVEAEQIHRDHQTILGHLY